MTILADITAMLEFGGLSPAESNAVTAALQAEKAFSYWNGIWALDTPAISSGAYQQIWGRACWQVVALIDALEPGHWARANFAGSAIGP